MKRLLLVDDDEVSREVLTVLAANAGYQVSAAESGDAALLALQQARPDGTQLDIVLADLGMTGITGPALAKRLRVACGTTVRLIAMSSKQAHSHGFDEFMRKPFTMGELDHLLGGGQQTQQWTDTLEYQNILTIPPLHLPTYEALRDSMLTSHLTALYILCIEDSERRIERMRRACLERSTQTYLDEAHAIRGSCGFVGALRLERMAAVMEATGLPLQNTQSPGSDTLDTFLLACNDLRRILIATL